MNFSATLFRENSDEFEDVGAISWFCVAALTVAGGGLVGVVADGVEWTCLGVVVVVNYFDVGVVVNYDVADMEDAVFGEDCESTATCPLGPFFN